MARRRSKKDEEYKEEEEEISESYEEEDGEDDEDDEDEDVLEKKELPQRSTRGKRTANFEEDEADQEFWSQDAWKELDEKDDDVKSSDFTSDDFADSADSDIDQDEEEEKKQEEQEAAEAAKDAKRGGRRLRDDELEDGPKKKSKYVDPALAKLRKKRGSLQQQQPGELTTSTTRKPRLPLAPRSIELRQSTKMVTESTKNAEKIPKRKRTPTVSTVVPKLTHREMLEAVALTEFENKRMLQEMIVLQEERKKRREAQEVDQEIGPRILFKSTVDGDTLSYSDATLFPQRKALPNVVPQRPICVVTGNPAKYRLPVKLIPFSNVEAYKRLKEMA